MIIARVLAAVATAAGIAAWIYYFRAGLVLSHYDAKAHLVVARRIFDSLTPGWEQIGAVWLPLPHLLNAIPVQVDLLYRTGAFASFISIACLGITTFATARLVVITTGSRLGAFVASALLILNPNLLYLHVTPMAEPLLLAAISLVVLWLYEWAPLNQDAVPLRLGVALFAAAWTRYEAWPVIAAALAAALYASARVGASLSAVLRRALTLGIWPAAAVLAFVVLSRVTVGAWLVRDGFYVRDPFYAHQLGRSALAVWWGTHELSTRATEAVAIATALLLFIRAIATRADAPLMILVSPLAAAAVPIYAFYEGHPFRIRYMVPLVCACALFGGLTVGSMRRQAAIVMAGLLIGITILQSPPWRQDAPMLIEARWDEVASIDRRKVTACLRDQYQGGQVIASMASLAHYMQELSHEGFDIKDFLHEGNGDIWTAALQAGPAAYAAWMLVEEQSEGGDALAQRIRETPGFAAGMQRVCEGGGVALYRRQEVPTSRISSRR